MILYIENTIFLMYYKAVEVANMKIIKVDNYNEASAKAFEVFKNQIITQPESILGLATGSTPRKLYEMMIEDHQTNGTSYKQVKTFNLDEYVGLDGADEQSYEYFMNHNLFDHIDIDKQNTHVPSGIGDIAKNIADYNQMLKDNPIDLQLLGIGSNGHIGFNEPGTAKDSVTSLVDLKQSTIDDNARLFFGGDVTKVPTQAISMGIANILAAKKIVLIACGQNKADAIKTLIEGKESSECPASFLQSHPDVTVIIDKEAASALK